MIPQELVEYAKINLPQYSGDENTFLERLFTYGLSLPVAGMPDSQYYLPGQVVSSDPVLQLTGPYGRNCKFMFVAVAPNYEDYGMMRHFSGSTVGPSAILKEALTNAGFNLSECYFTSVMRYPRSLNSSSYKQCWLRPGWELLKEEVQILRPTVICFLGAEVLKLAKGNDASLDSVRGQPFEFETPRWKCSAMAVQSHQSFLANTAGLPAFVKQLIMVKHLVSPGGVPVMDGLEYPGRDYKILWTIEDIRKAVDEELAAGTHTIAIDAEWGTDTGRPDDTYMTTFQWSSRAEHGRIIPMLVERPEPMIEVTSKSGTVSKVLKYGGSGVDAKSINDRVDHYGEIGAEIRRLLDGVKRRAGHAIRGDLTILETEFGIPVRQYMTPAGIFDTMQAYHVLEKDEYGLKQLTLRYTNMGAYDAPMNDYVIRNGGVGKLFPGAKEDRYFHAYRDIPYKYLLPYAMCDTDATWRLVSIMEERLNAPGNEKIKELYYNTLLPLNSPLKDVEGFGFCVDLERAEKLSKLYQRKYDQLLDEFREMISWSTFNPNSPRDVPGLLYRGPFKDCDKCFAKIPAEAVRLGLTPPWETGKFGRNWDELVGEEAYHSPSCEGKALKKMLTSIPDLTPEARKVLKAMCELKDLSQFVKNFMRDPVHDSLTGPEYARYGKGLIGCILNDGRMKTQISTLAETHRWKHRKPNLANLPKTKEEGIQNLFAAHMDDEDEAEILGIDDGAVEVKVDKDGKEVEIVHIPKVRSIFVAPPGWKLIEADYKSAELWVMGLLSGDEKFCHVLETEPDMHAYNAIQIFKLDCKVSEVKKKYPLQRFAVKAVTFGISYGLGASGLADQLSLEFGRFVSTAEAQQIIDGYFEQYPGLKKFFERCALEVEQRGYVETPFGSRRYFPGFARVGKSQQAKMKREGMNAVIQGTVAILLDKASVLLDQLRYDTDFGRMVGWEYCLGLHDAMYVYAPAEMVDTTVAAVKWAMESVIIPGYRNLQVDIDIMERWGEKAA